VKLTDERAGPSIFRVIGRDDVQTDIRMQPMVRVLHGETLLSIDERFLALVQPDDVVV